MNDLPRVTYSNTGEDFSGVHAHLDAVIPDVQARLLGKVQPAFIGGRDRGEGPVVEARSPIDRDIVLGEFPQADAALFKAIETTLVVTGKRRLQRLPLHINDPQFAGAIVAARRDIAPGPA